MSVFFNQLDCSFNVMLFSANRCSDQSFSESLSPLNLSSKYLKLALFGLTVASVYGNRVDEFEW